MATATISAMVDEVLTMDEIKNRYDSEWVLVADPKMDDEMNVLSGKVICHHKDRDVFDDKTMKIEPFPREAAFIYLGKCDGIYIL